MNKKIFLITLLFITLACAIPGAISPVNLPQATSDISRLETMVVQTSGAAQSQTANAIPTLTFTATPTRTPSSTPTPTATFKFLFPTFTLIPTQTPIGQISTGGGSAGTPEKSIFTGHPWSCRVIGVEPPRWAVLQKEQEFYAYWTLINTGTKTWTRTTIDLVYTGGWRHDGTKIIDITGNARTGSTVRVGTKFVAPKKPGEYESFFSLKVGKTEFCGMSILFVINN